MLVDNENVITLKLCDESGGATVGPCLETRFPRGQGGWGVGGNATPQYLQYFFM